MSQITKICYACRCEADLYAQICPNCRAKLGGRKKSGIASSPTACLPFFAGALGLLLVLAVALNYYTNKGVEDARAAEQAALAAERARLKAAPPAEHIAWAKPMLELLKKKWDVATFDQVIGRLSMIDKTTPEGAEAADLMRTGWALQRSANALAVKAEKIQNERIAKSQEPLRIEYAKNLETEFLEKRINADVRASGPGHTTLTIKWILVNKVSAHDMGKNHSLHENLRRLHFKKMILTDGYDESWIWTY